MTWDPSSQNCNAEIEQTDSDNVGPVVNCPIDASWSPATLKCNAEFDQAGTEGTGHDWVNCPLEPICEPGDGQGSSETFALKTDTIFECTDYVKANFPSANGATWGVSNKNCFAEFEQNGTDG